MTLYLNGTTGVSGVDGSAGTPAIQGTDTNTGISFPAADTIAFNEGGAEVGRFDSSGRLLVGTSTSTGFVPPGESFTTAATLQVSGSSGSGASSLQVTDTVTGDYGLGGSLFLNKHRSDNGGIGNNHTFGSILFASWDTAALRVGASIRAVADGQTWASGDCPSRLVFSTTADGASSPTERMRITSGGTVITESHLQCKGRLYWSGGADGSSLSTSSIGGSTTTVYIGNAAIQVSSDARLKDNIKNTELDAIQELKKVRVVDFTWSDPSDTSYNNRNARGIWTGLIAQELIDIFPFVVNAPRKEENLSVDYDSENTWTVDQNQLVPVLIKAFQQQQERIEQLEARLTAAGIS
jgi:hypothetical protein